MQPGAMERVIDRAAESVPDTLAVELDLIRGAVALVAGGTSRRVVVAGLRFGPALLEPARRMARQAGLEVVPDWTADEAGVDIAVERRPG